jgi:hypothetical protein
MSFYVNLLLAELFGCLSFMVAKNLVSTFSDLWAVTQIINTFNFSVIFIGLQD